MAGWQTKAESLKTTYVLPAECRLDQKLCPGVIEYLDDNVSFFGKIQRTAWHLVNQQAMSKGDLNKYLQEEFHIKSRMANSVIDDMQSRHKSLMELKKVEARDLKERIAKKEEMIKEDKKTVDMLCFLAGANLCDKELPSLKRKLQAGLYQKQMKLDRMKNQLKKVKKEIETGVLSVCFGTKKLFKKQYELKKAGYKSHQEWLEDFRKNRDKGLYCLARGEETMGNQTCHLNFTQYPGLFKLTVLGADKDTRVAAEGYVRFSCCLSELERQLEWHQNNKPWKMPITARFVKREKGWYLILSLNVKKMPIYTHDKANGVVSMDFNEGFIELAELNKTGNLISQKHISICHAGKTPEGKHETLAAVKEAVQYAAFKEKPLAVENLDFSKKKSKLVSGHGKRYNRMLTTLNFAQYTEALIRRCQKDGVELIVVNPAGTSKAGKKYMQAMQLNVHEAAAWQVGRRAMGYKLKRNKSLKQKQYEAKRKEDIKKKAKDKRGRVRRQFKEEHADVMELMAVQKKTEKTAASAAV